MKYLSFFTALILLALLASTTSCRKCLCCWQTSTATIIITKAGVTDTINLVNTTAKKFNDSLNYYQNQGFNVNPISNAQISVFCGQHDINQVISQGYLCPSAPHQDGGDCI